MEQPKSTEDPGLNDGEDALETPEPGSSPAANQTSGQLSVALPGPKKDSLKDKIKSGNLYLLLFGLIIVIAVAVISVGYFQGQKKDTVSTVVSQTLNQKALDQLASASTVVGDPKQVLAVQSNAVFNGKVLVRGSLEVAGGLQVGGTLSLQDVKISGTAIIDTVQINKNISVGGDSAISGTSSVQRSLQVNGGGTFGGPISAPQLTTSVLQLNGELTLTKHITAGGASPSRTNGPALGSGGTSSVGGSDTAGSISINTGSGTSAGCYLSITFAQKYNSTPRVIISPVGADAGGLSYYVTRTTTGFSVCSTTAATAGATFAFDYFVVS
jgi:hypothetical protein